MFTAVSESESLARARPGEKPSGKKVAEGISSAKVEAIDYQARTVGLKDSKGSPLSHKVDERAKRFNEVKPGDMVVVEYTQTVAVSVKKP